MRRLLIISLGMLWVAACRPQGILTFGLESPRGTTYEIFIDHQLAKQIRSDGPRAPHVVRSPDGKTTTTYAPIEIWIDHGVHRIAVKRNGVVAWSETVHVDDKHDKFYYSLDHGEQASTATTSATVQK